MKEIDDHTFASEIANEFKIPLQDLTPIIKTIRIWKQIHPEKTYTPSAQRKIYKNREFARIIDLPINAIHLETANDVIHLTEADPLFHYFEISIKRMKSAFNREMIASDRQWNKVINTWAERQIFRYFIMYFRNSSLIQFNQRAIIGLFFAHFEIKKIDTPEQWQNNMRGADNYNDYLNNIVKNMHNKYLKELSP